MVGRRTCDLRVAGSRPGRDAAAQQHWASCSHPTASVTKQYNLVPAKGSKQAYHVVHQPVSRGLAVFADAWLSGWLADISADLRVNGSALEVVPRRCAIQIHDFTLLYFY